MPKPFGFVRRWVERVVRDEVHTMAWVAKDDMPEDGHRHLPDGQDSAVRALSMAIDFRANRMARSEIAHARQQETTAYTRPVKATPAEEGD